MIPNVLFGASSVACFGLPIFVILSYRLYRHASLIALMVYYTFAILHCLGSNSMPPSPDFSNTWEVLYNYIETPLMLLSLLFFCPASQRQQKIQLMIRLFVAYEVVIAFWFGFTPLASLYIMAPGLLVIVLYAQFLFLRQLRFTLLHGKNRGRVLMLGSIVFSYSCYLFMFYAYFFQEKKDISAIYSVHFFSSTIAAVLMSAGLYMMRHRIKELQELKVTRKELQMVFGS
jgi:hypothetical protein